MSSSLLRQDVLPVAVGYLLLMGALAAGLRLTWRDGHPPGAARDGAAGAARDGAAGAELGGAAGAARDGAAGAARAGHPARAGSLRLVRHYAGTAVGGYLLLMAVVVLYYFGVARVGGPFIRSAFTGCALLIGLSAPVFALASWLTGRRSSRAGRRRSRAGRRHADPPAPRATP
jgi:hypothetical protein